MRQTRFPLSLTTGRLCPFLLFAIISFSLVLTGCSGRRPFIDQNEWYINYRNDLKNNKIYEELALFLLVKDEDGIEDIEEIYLINEKEEIFWRITEEVKIIHKEGKRAWIGASRLIPENGKKFPNGTYRVVIQDKAGSSAEIAISIPKDRLNLKQSLFPKINYTDKTLNISGKRNIYQIWFYDENDTLLFRKESAPGSIDLDQLTGNEFSNRKPYYALIYYFLENRFAGVIVGPVYFYERSSPSFTPEDFSLPQGDI